MCTCSAVDTGAVLVESEAVGTSLYFELAIPTTVTIPPDAPSLFEVREYCYGMSLRESGEENTGGYMFLCFGW